MYLSFGSDILEENQVTDYLIRVVQPRLSAIEGVQRADILGGRTFAIRAWLKPDRMAALDVSPAQVRAALAANNYLAAVGQTKGQLVQINLTASTDLQSVDEFRKLVVRENGGTLVRLEDVAEVVLGADTYDQEVRFSGNRAVFMGIWVLPNANSLDVINRVNTEIKAIQKELPTGMTRQRRLRRDQVHPQRRRRGRSHPARDGPHRDDRHLPLSRLVPHRPGPHRRHSRSRSSAPSS